MEMKKWNNIPDKNYIAEFKKLSEAKGKKIEGYIRIYGDGSGGGGGVSDFDDLTGRPKIDNKEMTSSTVLRTFPTTPSQFTTSSNYLVPGAKAGQALTPDMVLSAKGWADIKNYLPSVFVGTDGETAGEQGLVPAPATTDANKYLKADGTWGTPQWGEIKGTLADQTDLQDALDSKADFSEIPSNVSDLENDAGYQTSSDVQTAIAGKANIADVPVITMQTTDPGEGVDLAENHFIAVYNA